VGVPGSSAATWCATPRAMLDRHPARQQYDERRNETDGSRGGEGDPPGARRRQRSQAANPPGGRRRTGSTENAKTRRRDDGITNGPRRACAGGGAIVLLQTRAGPERRPGLGRQTGGRTGRTRGRHGCDGEERPLLVKTVWATQNVPSLGKFNVRTQKLARPPPRTARGTIADPHPNRRQEGARRVEPGPGLQQRARVVSARARRRGISSPANGRRPAAEIPRTSE
jgi:hypothetical protein